MDQSEINRIIREIAALGSSMGSIYPLNPSINAANVPNENSQLRPPISITKYSKYRTDLGDDRAKFLQIMRNSRKVYQAAGRERREQEWLDIKKSFAQRIDNPPMQPNRRPDIYDIPQPIRRQLVSVISKTISAYIAKSQDNVLERTDIEVKQGRDGLSIRVGSRTHNILVSSDIPRILKNGLTDDIMLPVLNGVIGAIQLENIRLKQTAPRLRPSRGYDNMRVLLTGDATKKNLGRIEATLAKLPKNSLIVHDLDAATARLVKEMADKMGLSVQHVQDNNELFGNRAGYVGNQWRLETKPHLVMAFHDEVGVNDPSRKTGLIGSKSMDLLVRAIDAGIPTYVNNLPKTDVRQIRKTLRNRGQRIYAPMAQSERRAIDQEISFRKMLQEVAAGTDPYAAMKKHGLTNDKEIMAVIGSMAESQHHVSRNHVNVDLHDDVIKDVLGNYNHDAVRTLLYRELGNISSGPKGISKAYDELRSYWRTPTAETNSLPLDNLIQRIQPHGANIQDFDRKLNSYLTRYLILREASGFQSAGFDTRYLADIQALRDEQRQAQYIGSFEDPQEHGLGRESLNEREIENAIGRMRDYDVEYGGEAYRSVRSRFKRMGLTDSEALLIGQRALEIARSGDENFSFNMAASTSDVIDAMKKEPQLSAKYRRLMGKIDARVQQGLGSDEDVARVLRKLQGIDVSKLSGPQQEAIMKAVSGSLRWTHQPWYQQYRDWDTFISAAIEAAADEKSDMPLTSDKTRPITPEDLTSAHFSGMKASQVLTSKTKKKYRDLAAIEDEIKLFDRYIKQYSGSQPQSMWYAKNISKLWSRRDKLLAQPDEWKYDGQERLLVETIANRGDMGETAMKMIRLPNGEFSYVTRDSKRDIFDDYNAAVRAKALFRIQSELSPEIPKLSESLLSMYTPTLGRGRNLSKLSPAKQTKYLAQILKNGVLGQDIMADIARTALKATYDSNLQQLGGNGSTWEQFLRQHTSAAVIAAGGMPSMKDKSQVDIARDERIANEMRSSAQMFMQYEPRIVSNWLTLGGGLENYIFGHDPVLVNALMSEDVREQFSQAIASELANTADRKKLDSAQGMWTQLWRSMLFGENMVPDEAKNRAFLKDSKNIFKQLVNNLGPDSLDRLKTAPWFVDMPFYEWHDGKNGKKEFYESINSLGLGGENLTKYGDVWDALYKWVSYDAKKGRRTRIGEPRAKRKIRDRSGNEIEETYIPYDPGLEIGNSIYTRSIFEYMKRATEASGQGINLEELFSTYHLPEEGAGLGNMFDAARAVSGWAHRHMGFGTSTDPTKMQPKDTYRKALKELRAIDRFQSDLTDPLDSPLWTARIRGVIGNRSMREFLGFIDELDKGASGNKLDIAYQMPYGETLYSIEPDIFTAAIVAEAKRRGTPADQIPMRDIEFTRNLIEEMNRRTNIKVARFGAIHGTDEKGNPRVIESYLQAMQSTLSPMSKIGPLMQAFGISPETPTGHIPATQFGEMAGSALALKVLFGLATAGLHPDETNFNELYALFPNLGKSGNTLLESAELMGTLRTAGRSLMYGAEEKVRGEGGKLTSLGFNPNILKGRYADNPSSGQFPVTTDILIRPGDIIQNGKYAGPLGLAYKALGLDLEIGQQIARDLMGMRANIKSSNPALRNLSGISFKLANADRFNAASEAEQEEMRWRDLSSAGDFFYQLMPDMRGATTGEDPGKMPSDYTRRAFGFFKLASQGNKQITDFLLAGSGNVRMLADMYKFVRPFMTFLNNNQRLTWSKKSPIPIEDIVNPKGKPVLFHQGGVLPEDVQGIGKSGQRYELQKGETVVPTQRAYSGSAFENMIPTPEQWRAMISRAYMLEMPSVAGSGKSTTAGWRNLQQRRGTLVVPTEQGKVLLYNDLSKIDPEKYKGLPMEPGIVVSIAKLTGAATAKKQRDYAVQMYEAMTGGMSMNIIGKIDPSEIQAIYQEAGMKFNPRSVLDWVAGGNASSRTLHSWGWSLLKDIYGMANQIQPTVLEPTDQRELMFNILKDQQIDTEFMHYKNYTDFRVAQGRNVSMSDQVTARRLNEKLEGYVNLINLWRARMQRPLNVTSPEIDAGQLIEDSYDNGLVPAKALDLYKKYNDMLFSPSSRKYISPSFLQQHNKVLGPGIWVDFSEMLTHIAEILEGNLGYSAREIALRNVQGSAKNLANRFRVATFDEIQYFSKAASTVASHSLRGTKLKTGELIPPLVTITGDLLQNQLSSLGGEMTFEDIEQQLRAIWGYTPEQIETVELTKNMRQAISLNEMSARAGGRPVQAASTEQGSIGTLMEPFSMWQALLRLGGDVPNISGKQGASIEEVVKAAVGYDPKMWNTTDFDKTSLAVRYLRGTNPEGLIPHASIPDVFSLAAGNNEQSYRFLKESGILGGTVFRQDAQRGAALWMLKLIQSGVKARDISMYGVRGMDFFDVESWSNEYNPYKERQYQSHWANPARNFDMFSGLEMLANLGYINKPPIVIPTERQMSALYDTEVGDALQKFFIQNRERFSDYNIDAPRILSGARAVGLESDYGVLGDLRQSRRLNPDTLHLIYQVLNDPYMKITPEQRYMLQKALSIGYVITSRPKKGAFLESSLGFDEQDPLSNMLAAGVPEADIQLARTGNLSGIDPWQAFYGDTRSVFSRRHALMPQLQQQYLRDPMSMFMHGQKDTYPAIKTDLDNIFFWAWKTGQLWDIEQKGNAAGIRHAGYRFMPYGWPLGLKPHSLSKSMATGRVRSGTSDKQDELLSWAMQQAINLGVEHSYRGMNPFVVANRANMAGMLLPGSMHPVFRFSSGTPINVLPDTLQQIADAMYISEMTGREMGTGLNAFYGQNGITVNSINGPVAGTSGYIDMAPGDNVHTHPKGGSVAEQTFSPGDREMLQNSSQMLGRSILSMIAGRKGGRHVNLYQAHPDGAIDHRGKFSLPMPKVRSHSTFTTTGGMNIDLEPFMHAIGGIMEYQTSDPGGSDKLINLFKNDIVNPAQADELISLIASNYAPHVAGRKFSAEEIDAVRQMMRHPQKNPSSSVIGQMAGTGAGMIEPESVTINGKTYTMTLRKSLSPEEAKINEYLKHIAENTKAMAGVLNQVLDSDAQSFPNSTFLKTSQDMADTLKKLEQLGVSPQHAAQIGTSTGQVPPAQVPATGTPPKAALDSSQPSHYDPKSQMPIDTSTGSGGGGRRDPGTVNANQQGWEFNYNTKLGRLGRTMGQIGYGSMIISGMLEETLDQQKATALRTSTNINELGMALGLDMSAKIPWKGLTNDMEDSVRYMIEQRMFNSDESGIPTYMRGQFSPNQYLEAIKSVSQRYGTQLEPQATSEQIYGFLSNSNVSSLADQYLKMAKLLGTTDQNGQLSVGPLVETMSSIATKLKLPMDLNKQGALEQTKSVLDLATSFSVHGGSLDYLNEALKYMPDLEQIGFKDNSRLFANIFTLQKAGMTQRQSMGAMNWAYNTAMSPTEQAAWEMWRNFGKASMSNATGIDIGFVGTNMPEVPMIRGLNGEMRLPSLSEFQQYIQLESAKSQKEIAQMTQKALPEKQELEKLNLDIRGAQLNINQAQLNFSQETLPMQRQIAASQYALSTMQLGHREESLDIQERKLTRAQSSQDRKLRLMELGFQIDDLQWAFQGNQLERQYENLGFARWMRGMMYGTPNQQGALQIANANWSQQNLANQRSGATAGLIAPVQLSATGANYGLQGEQFVAGLEHQRAQMVYSRSRLLTGAAFSENMEYLEKQKRFFERQAQLQEIQFEFEQRQALESLNEQKALREAMLPLIMLQREEQRKQWESTSQDIADSITELQMNRDELALQKTVLDQQYELQQKQFDNEEKILAAQQNILALQLLAYDNEKSQLTINQDIEKLNIDRSVKDTAWQEAIAKYTSSLESQYMAQNAGIIDQNGQFQFDNFVKMLSMMSSAELDKFLVDTGASEQEKPVLKLLANSDTISFIENIMKIFTGDTKQGGLLDKLFNNYALNTYLATFTRGQAWGETKDIQAGYAQEPWIELAADSAKFWTSMEKVTTSLTSIEESLKSIADIFKWALVPGEIANIANVFLQIKGILGLGGAATAASTAAGTGTATAGGLSAILGSGVLGPLAALLGIGAGTATMAAITANIDEARVAQTQSVIDTMSPAERAAFQMVPKPVSQGGQDIRQDLVYILDEKGNFVMKEGKPITQTAAEWLEKYRKAHEELLSDMNLAGAEVNVELSKVQEQSLTDIIQNNITNRHAIEGVYDTSLSNITGMSSTKNEEMLIDAQTKQQKIAESFSTNISAMEKSLDATLLFKNFSQKLADLKKEASEKILINIDIDPSSGLYKILNQNMTGGITGPMALSGSDNDGIINQYLMGKALGLSDEQAWSLCGPAAGLSMANAGNANMTAEQIFSLASGGNGMAPLWGQYEPGKYAMYGPDAFNELLKRMGIDAQRTTMYDYNEAEKTNQAIAALANSPLITMSGSKHYWVADDYDPLQGGFHVGDSGTAMAKYGGKEWMSMAEIEAIDPISNMWSLLASQFLKGNDSFMLQALQAGTMQQGPSMSPEQTEEQQQDLTNQMARLWELFGANVEGVYATMGEDAKTSKNNILDITAIMLAELQNILTANPIQLQMILVPPTEEAITNAIAFISQFGKSSAEELMEMRANLIKCQIEQKMAGGGIVWDPTVALIGESGPEMVVNRTQLNNMLGELSFDRDNMSEGSLERLINLLENQQSGHNINVNVTQNLNGSAMTDAEKSALKADTIDTIQKALEPLLK